MLGHDAVAQALVDHGVDTVFGVLGDGNLFIGENLQRQHQVNLVGATPEAVSYTHLTLPTIYSV